MKRQELDEEEYYVEKTKTGLSETIRKANWGPLIFYIGLAVTGTIILLFIALMLGPPLSYVFLAFAGILDILSILNAKAYGWPGGIITEGCEFIGFRRLILKFPDGRERMNEGDLYYDATVGDNGLIPLKDMAKYLGIDESELPDTIRPADYTGGILKLHLKSNYGRASSSIFLVYIPEHAMKVHSTVLPLLVTPTEKKLTANNREWPTFAGAYYNPFTTPVGDQYVFLKQADKIADFILSLVSTEELEAEVEALQFKVEAQEKRISKLLKARDDLRDTDESIEESGGEPKRWYEITAVRIILELAIITGLALAVIFVTGVIL